MLRLAALAVEVLEDAERLGDRLRLSNSERERLARAATASVEAWRALPSPDAVKVLVYGQGNEAARDLLLIAWTRSLATAPDDAAWSARLDLARQWRAPKFALTGADVMALGVAEGPRIGELLRRVEEWWIAAGFPEDRSLLQARLAQEKGSDPAGLTPGTTD
jgi:poly(A) polymerase